MDSVELSFKELILRARSGDKDAFGTIYETHLTPLYRYTLSRVGVREEAEDVVQEAFLRAYEALPRFEATRANFLPYLFTIARNLLINRSKKKRADTMPAYELDREFGTGNTSEEAETHESLGMIRKAMESLSETEREVVELRFFGEQSYAEIAHALDKKEDAIRQHIARAMKKLRVQMASRQ